MTQKTVMAACIAAALLGGCATNGTRVTSTSETYKTMAYSQHPWCSTFDATCTCAIEGHKATCSLVYACLSSGNCTVAP